jgi:hypothetical protein
MHDASHASGFGGGSAILYDYMGLFPALEQSMYDTSDMQHRGTTPTALPNKWWFDIL